MSSDRSSNAMRALSADTTEAGPTTLTSHQIRCVQTSWRRLSAREVDIPAVFYAHLFELDPLLRSLFEGDMARQHQKFQLMMVSAIEGLENLSSLRPILQELGHRHSAYGVQAAHYPIVTDALLRTLRSCLEADLDDETAEAWKGVLAMCAAVMRGSR